MREIFWIIFIIALGYCLYKRLLLKSPLFHLLRFVLNRQPHSAQTHSKKKQAIQPMVRCAYCQVHLPKQEAVCDGVTYFCSHHHQKAYSK